MKIMIDQYITRECCGCKMCADLCPNGAIKFEADHEGFWYPKTDVQKCIRCGLCVQRCPVLNETGNENAFDPDVYCAWILDEEIRLKSTSGGVYYALAQTMLKQNGYLSGCVFTDDWKSAKHIITNNEEGLNRIFRSKYFQSDTEGIYKEIHGTLKRGERLLFCGTPCQNAALRQYLKTDYDNLIQCDFVCRGINSPKAHQAHIQELEKKHNSNVDFFNFKNKKNGWTALGTLVCFKNGEQEFSDRHSNAWVQGYILGNLYMRPSCEYCHFKRIPRLSDISIGDFWGLQKDKEVMEKGMSLVMINTEKGRRFFSETLPLIYAEPQTLETAISGNGCILRSPKVDHNMREKFFANIDNETFSSLVYKLVQREKRKMFLQKCFGSVCQTLKRKRMGNNTH